MKNDILQKTIELAKNSKSIQEKICSIIVNKKGLILSIGYNSYKKTHPLQKKYARKTGNNNKIYLHSEISCIIGLSYDSKPYAIYVARVNNNGEPLLARPCAICELAIKEAGIKNIYYTT